LSNTSPINQVKLKSSIDKNRIERFKQGFKDAIRRAGIFGLSKERRVLIRNYQLLKLYEQGEVTVERLLSYTKEVSHKIITDQEFILLFPRGLESVNELSFYVY